MKKPTHSVDFKSMLLEIAPLFYPNFQGDASATNHLKIHIEGFDDDELSVDDLCITIQRLAVLRYYFGEDKQFSLQCLRVNKETIKTGESEIPTKLEDFGIYKGIELLHRAHKGRFSLYRQGQNIFGIVVSDDPSRPITKAKFFPFEHYLNLIEEGKEYEDIWDKLHKAGLLSLQSLKQSA